MAADIQAYLPLILIVLALAAVVIWALMRSNRKARVLVDEQDRGTLARDVLEEGAARAKRNEVLIEGNAAPAYAQGPLSATANTQLVAASTLGTDSEAGADVVPVKGPAPEVKPLPKSAPHGPGPDPVTGDDLTRIKGVGPKLVALLNSLGVSTYRQIAEWNEADVERIDAQLGRFSGRIARDNWIEQAKLLSSGDETTFAQKFGRNG